MLIFNFHHIEKDLFRPERKHISMTPQGLNRFIVTLRLLGLTIVSMRDVLTQQSDVIDDHRSVLLTFDDGYVNNLLQALPVLEAHQCPATVFVLPGAYGGTNTWDQSHLPESERDRLMSLAQMEQIAASPMITLGSHGLFHRSLPTLDESDMVAELTDSYHLLNEAFGENFLPVFAYPWGHYGQREVQALEKTPYKAAFSVETRPWRSTDNPYQIPRYSAYYRDGNPMVLLAKLAYQKLRSA
jgi:peptidoglycan/xylan/chitin deacetylase (PgdA/CDA1 family)